MRASMAKPRIINYVLLMTCFVLVAGSSRAGQVERGIQAEKAHFLVSFRGRTLGKVTRTLITEKDLLTLVVRESYRFSTGKRPVAENYLTRKITMKPDWTPLTISEVSGSQGHLKKRSARISGKKITFTLDSGKTRQVEVKTRIVAELNGMVLAARGLLKPGMGLTAAVPDLVQGGVVVLRASVLGARKMKGVPGEVLLLEVTTAGREQKWEMLVDHAGRLLEQTQGGMIRKRVLPSQAVLPDRPAVLSSGAIPLERAPEKFWRLKSMKLALTFPEPAKGLVPDIGGQQVINDAGGRKITVSLRRRMPDGQIPPEKLSVADRKLWQTPDGNADWRSDEFRLLAGKLTEKTPGHLRRGFLIARWVHRNMIKSLGGPPEASAAKALRTRTGDCTEHAAVFSALCRAVGIPARTAYGLVAARGALRFHAWSEFYAGGRWIPIDATAGRFGLPACYLTIGYDRHLAGARLFRFYAAARARVLNYQMIRAK
jgi:transglutaminase-like putative cysteine protease